jgi:hypothetical protein
MAIGCKFIFIRFNPDAYINEKGKKVNPEISTRLRELEKEIKKQIERINNEDNDDLLEIKHLYYSTVSKHIS